ncbi:MAG TPA: hypothetical protein VGI16_15825 [Candidatus Acidoferrum sp.]|jgi:hypothetical protein
MDHTEAVRLQAAVKYIMGELPAALREQYEEHYFDCAECALDLKTAAAFAESSRELFRQQAREEFRTQREAAIAPRGWFGWFRPIVAVPVFAMLLAAVVFQNVVTIPNAKKSGSLSAMQLTDRPVSLANTRGEGVTRISAAPNAPIPVDFDFTPSRPFNSYVAQLQDASGRSVAELRIPSDKANRTLHLLIGSGTVRLGSYTLLIAGDPSGNGRMDQSNEVQRLSFIVEIPQ